MTPLEKMKEFENENVWIVLPNGEKHLLYMGDNIADMTEAAIQQCWSEEKSAWDDVESRKH